MATRFQQTENEKHGIRRRATSKGINFGPIATAITIGVVAVLLGVTFIGDWLRVPKLVVEVSPSIISPNGDHTQDSTNFSYTLNEDAEVVVELLNERGNLINTIVNSQFQTRGQHIVTWDGLDQLGQVVVDGRYQLQVTAQGTVRAASQTATVLVDNLPPTLHLANLDQTTKVREANLTIEGLTDPNAVVQLQKDASIIPVSADGKFNIKRQLLEGVNNIQVSSTDPAGNITYVTREIILVTQPPEITISNPVNDQWTNESLITVAGLVPAGTTLKVNGQEAAVTADGAFKREVIMQEGDNILRIEATDDVGNISTQEIILHRKTTPPVLELSVEEGAAYQQSEVQVIGKTEAGAVVSVGGQNVVVSPLGEFQTTVALASGVNIIEVMAQDQAGNITKLQRTMSFEIATPESELARVARNLPVLSKYIVPVLISLPVLLIIAYFLTRPVSLVVSAENSDFRPGLPEEGRFLRLAIDLSKAARTTVEIKDKRGNTVATLLQRRHRTAGQQSLHWDGYDDFGKVALPGEYVVKATASATGGTVTGKLNISVLEDAAVHHRRYLRNSSYNENEQQVVRQQRQGEYTNSEAEPARRSRRR